MRTQPVFFFCFKHYVFIFYKVASHHLSLSTEAGLTGRQVGRQVDKRLRPEGEILPC